VNAEVSGFVDNQYSLQKLAAVDRYNYKKMSGVAKIETQAYAQLDPTLQVWGSGENWRLFWKQVFTKNLVDVKDQAADDNGCLFVSDDPPEKFRPQLLHEPCLAWRVLSNLYGEMDSRGNSAEVHKDTIQNLDLTWEHFVKMRDRQIPSAGTMLQQFVKPGVFFDNFREAPGNGPLDSHGIKTTAWMLFLKPDLAVKIPDVGTFLKNNPAAAEFVLLWMNTQIAVGYVTSPDYLNKQLLRPIDSGTSSVVDKSKMDVPSNGWYFQRLGKRDRHDPKLVAQQLFVAMSVGAVSRFPKTGRVDIYRGKPCYTNSINQCDTHFSLGNRVFDTAFSSYSKRDSLAKGYMRYGKNTQAGSCGNMLVKIQCTDGEDCYDISSISDAAEEVLLIPGQVLEVQHKTFNAGPIEMAHETNGFVKNKKGNNALENFWEMPMKLVKGEFYRQGTTVSMWKNTAASPLPGDSEGPFLPVTPTTPVSAVPSATKT